MNEQMKYFISSLTQHQHEVFRICMDLCQQKNTFKKTAREYDAFEESNTFKGMIAGYILMLKALKQDINKKLDPDFLLELHNEILFFKPNESISGSMGCDLDKRTSSFAGIRSFLINPITSFYLNLITFKDVSQNIQYTWLSQIYIKFILNILNRISTLQSEEIISKIKSNIREFKHDNSLTMFEQTFKDLVNSTGKLKLELIVNEVSQETKTMLAWEVSTIKDYIKLLYKSLDKNFDVLKELCESILASTAMVVSREQLENIFMEVQLSFKACFDLDATDPTSIVLKGDHYFDWFEYMNFGKTSALLDVVGTKDISKFRKDIDIIIQYYNNCITSVQDNDEKRIDLIIDVVMQLERIHPFSDGNCRTLCVVLLNYLLLQNNLKPSLMENPNCFDGLSKEELISEVKKGQNNFEMIFPKIGSSSVAQLSLKDTELEHKLYPELLEICQPLINYCNSCLVNNHLKIKAKCS